ncbi:protein DEPP1 [Pipistrellus kuhlii]|uniref:DEPP1 autophagy regulator n=1 Tax=Pipistrellus kuhlii TaxID=59472 RepID=A0A7J7T0J4_PIPKU|nr:protein DEPP1 [Pipistrellus kuhlii]KAF6294120.1 DEPP1 autophagy regulator [Pipistrellus kuhlii]
MRSRLLLSVARLPTIRESREEVLPGGPRQDALASPSLGEHRRSLCQLAQPASALTEAVAGARPGRRPWPARAGRKSGPPRSLQDITTPISGQQPPGTAEPLGWLFGQPQEEQPRCRGLPRRTSPSAEPWGPHRPTESSEAGACPNGKLYDARAPGRCPGGRLRDWHQGSRHPIPAAASPPSARPGSVLRSLCLHLPVIHEL